MPVNKVQTKPIPDVVKGVVIKRPIIYGSVSTKLPMPIEQQDGQPPHTHHWTLGIYSGNNTDLSTFVKRVQFKLHESFPNPSRSVDTPPFEIKETGYASFEAIIIVHARHYDRKSCQIRYWLPLFPTDGLERERLDRQREAYKHCLYDEMCFIDPPKSLYEALTAAGQDARLPEIAESGKFPFDVGREDAQLRVLDDEQGIIDAEVSKTKALILQKEAEITALQKTLADRGVAPQRPAEKKDKRKR